ncbi:flagellar basal-body MS-ring/collar protein FliF [Xylophilus sp. GOD-11R]|uniref:flagellar basal-body MS-ring/collar protein FliF n=1 Tax=Xylophilus sp. GOD-11R TaxID=3089814 RepID=UPI00298CC84A|nr:flagellar basal-body MS-ring/collar protein FliF [Xylophilus sp. GOD-11R]WPB57779.1 flagellar basal-body MS-ring/collar protein FliF [Xylophilus sp. GOD-11R]
MSAVAELPAASLAPAVAAPAWTQRLSSLDRAQRLKLGLGVAVLVVAGIAGIVMGRQAEYRVLFSNLGDKDGGAIVAQLSTMNIPYKYSEGGGAILVPSDRVHDIRLRLASQGLPKGSVAGFELMEGNRFGMTQFQERLTFQRGLEGELTRSIQSLASVQNARVHLALPNQNGFFREQQKPSASVLVTLQPGAELNRAQIAGIVHLVASSVPEMVPSAVSVLDDSGKLLSQAPDAAGNGAGGGDATQMQYTQQLEQNYARRVLEMLEPIVGRGNVKATVTADVDFSLSEQTSEQHKPNQSAETGAVRSQQVIESSGSNPNGNTPPTGVPGATSNQPPAQPAAPINGQAQPITAGTGNTGGGAAAVATTSKRESVTNYEVDKTVRVTRGGTPTVRRLSAAVVVNYAPATDAKAGPTALSAQQIEQMTALVRESIGFSKDRGDSVNLMNAPFMVAAADTNAVPLWKQPEILDLARSMAWPVGTFLFGALVLMGFIRPALKAMRQPPVKVLSPGDPGFIALDGSAGGAGSIGGQLNLAVSDDNPRPALGGPDETALLPASPQQVRLDEARMLARKNPIAVANIVKEWVNGEAPA